MPLETPTALDTLVQTARLLSFDEFEQRFSSPVLVVVPTSDNIVTEAVDITNPGPAYSSSGADSAAVVPTTLVFWVRRGKHQPPNSTRLTVGRDDSNDVVIPFGSMSKLHAYLNEVAPDRWQVEDAASTNGTWVDGRQVAAKGSAAVRDGAEVKFGDVVGTFWLATSFRAAVRRRAGIK